MNMLVPSYYSEFKCIANRCSHSCCIGWDICIDDNALEKYRALNNDLGEKIRECISFDDRPHFKLDKGGRCPFLNEYGLCEIIIEKGEDLLCDICANHPRFYNYYDNFTEAGLGLCCERASEIILKKDEPLSLVLLKGDGNILVTEEEEDMLVVRQQIFEILQNRRLDVAKRLEQLASAVGIDISLLDVTHTLEKYLSLKRLDEGWTSLLKGLSDTKATVFAGENHPFEQLACYFIYRHFCEGLLDGDFLSKIKLAISGCVIIGAMCEKYGGDITEYARMFSAEVEYSEENLAAIYRLL